MAAEAGGASSSSWPPREDADGQRPAPWLLQVCPSSEVVDSTNGEAKSQKGPYLWQSRSDAELLSLLDALFGDFDQLTLECDELYQTWLQEEGGNPMELLADRLHLVTQRLIDRFGVRSETVLERIATVYSTLSSNCGVSVGKVEFRGYVASLLTQVHRELEDRVSVVADVATVTGHSSLGGLAATHASETLASVAASNGAESCVAEAAALSIEDIDATKAAKVAEEETARSASVAGDDNRPTAQAQPNVLPTLSHDEAEVGTVEPNNAMTLDANDGNTEVTALKQPGMTSPDVNAASLDIREQPLEEDGAQHTFLAAEAVAGAALSDGVDSYAVEVAKSEILVDATQPPMVVEEETTRSRSHADDSETQDVVEYPCASASIGGDDANLAEKGPNL